MFKDPTPTELDYRQAAQNPAAYQLLLHKLKKMKRLHLTSALCLFFVGVIHSLHHLSATPGAIAESPTFYRVAPLMTVFLLISAFFQIGQWHALRAQMMLLSFVDAQSQMNLTPSLPQKL
ncbi:hypothetical protein SAMN02745166_02575 [Prosthecobacter debontii]|uniref:Uncharacterized protein n=1 Tax=Prosthecobacter debontii TaxID=48467 RepID=A0A1T4Y6E4_9BACT|nr:hypothetical protein [Prosthecobacter debontii]SKA97233.1 hypothetical protein SAMN02745166_02575 [Prosthecobacter debontii]